MSVNRIQNRRAHRPSPCCVGSHLPGGQVGMTGTSSHMRPPPRKDRQLWEDVGTRQPATGSGQWSGGQLGGAQPLGQGAPRDGGDPLGVQGPHPCGNSRCGFSSPAHSPLGGRSSAQAGVGSRQPGSGTGGRPGPGISRATSCRLPARCAGAGLLGTRLRVGAAGPGGGVVAETPPPQCCCPGDQVLEGPPAVWLQPPYPCS